MLPFFTIPPFVLLICPDLCFAVDLKKKTKAKKNKKKEERTPEEEEALVKRKVGIGMTDSYIDTWMHRKAIGTHCHSQLLVAVSVILHYCTVLDPG